jgi:MFS superfamily sulfate permease-like transporter
LRDLLRIAQGILGGQANWTSFAVGAGTLAAILVLKPCKRIPGLLLAVVAATIVVGILNLKRERRRKSSRSAAARTAIVCIAYDRFCSPE